MTKSQRQHVLARLLGQQAVSSQAQLVDLLAAEGIVATQATVSRDLEDVGAVKVRNPSGDSVYAIPEYPIERVAPPDHLRRVLGGPHQGRPTWSAQPSTGPAWTV